MLVLLNSEFWVPAWVCWRYSVWRMAAVLPRGARRGNRSVVLAVASTADVRQPAVRSNRRCGMEHGWP